MSTEQALLTLIGELYASVQRLQARVVELEAELARREPSKSESSE